MTGNGRQRSKVISIINRNKGMSEIKRSLPVTTAKRPAKLPTNLPAMFTDLKGNRDWRSARIDTNNCIQPEVSHQDPYCSLFSSFRQANKNPLWITFLKSYHYFVSEELVEISQSCHKKSPDSEVSKVLRFIKRKAVMDMWVVDS